MGLLLASIVIGLLMFGLNAAMADEISRYHGDDRAKSWMILFKKGVLSTSIVLTLPVTIPVFILGVVFRLLEDRFGTFIQEKINWLLKVQTEEK